MTNILIRHLGALLLIIATVSCERTFAPRQNRLADIRAAAAPHGFGAFNGRLRGRDPAEPERCYQGGQPLRDIRVELGLWHGEPAKYRDTVTRAIPTRLDDPRFELLAATVTDADGRFRFPALPRRAPFAFRAVPPRESPWQIGYGVSLFGIGNVDFADHPTLCLERRSPQARSGA